MGMQEQIVTLRIRYYQSPNAMPSRPSKWALKHMLEVDDVEVLAEGPARVLSQEREELADAG